MVTDKNNFQKKRKKFHMKKKSRLNFKKHKKLKSKPINNNSESTDSIVNTNTVSTITAPIIATSDNTLSNNSKADELVSNVNDVVENVEDVADTAIESPSPPLVSAQTFVSAASMDSGIKTIPSNNHNSKITQIAAPIISIFGGIALVAVAMFFVVRKRKRNSTIIQNKTTYNDDDDGEKLHDIPLNDIEDEAVLFNQDIPKLIETPSNNNSKMIHNSLALSSSNNYTQHSYSFNYKQYDYALYQDRQLDTKKNEEDNRQSVYYNSLDYQSSIASDTLVGSQTTTRTNSMKNRESSSTRKPSLIISTSRPISKVSCNRSSCSSVYTDALVSPTSTIAPYMSTFLMVAERQQLQHEKPNILDYYQDQLKSSKSTPIEVYRAQLSQLDDDDDDMGQGATFVDIPSPVFYPSTLPFFEVVDFTYEDCY